MTDHQRGSILGAGANGRRLVLILVAARGRESHGSIGRCVGADRGPPLRAGDLEIGPSGAA